MLRARPLVFASLLLCTACPSDDSGDEAADSGSSESTTDSTTDTGTETETETGPSCGVAAGVCCMELEPCEVTEDCCEPETYTCTLEGPTLKCVDLEQMCMDCLANCMAPPDVCTNSCMVWCNPP